MLPDGKRDGDHAQRHGYKHILGSRYGSQTPALGAERDFNFVHEPQQAGAEHQQ